MVLKKIKKVYFLFFILFSLLVALSYGFSIDQRGVSAALVISGKILYPDTNNVLYLWYNNSWTLTHHFITYLLKIGLTVEFLNILILFIVTLINVYGIFLISKSITNNYLFSAIISLFSIITRINLGDLDFPVLIFSEHTNALIGTALPILIFGLIGNKNFKLAYFFCLLNIFLHLVIGFWIFLILLISLYFFKNKNLNFELKSTKTIFLLLISFSLFFLIFINYNLNRISIPYSENLSLYKDYLNIWDHHRGNFFKINFIYIFLSFFLSFLILLILKDKKIWLNEYQKLMLKIILTHIILSFILYISYKILPSLFPTNLVRIMPSRLFLIHSFFGPSLIVSILFSLYFKYLKKVKFINYFFLLIVLLHPIFYLDKYINRVEIIYENFFKNKNYDKKFWNKIKNEKTLDGLILTSINACSKTLQKAYKPILICVETIDYVNYIPSLLPPVKEILQDIYKIDFLNPPEKFHGGIWYDRTYKNVFENRSYKEWIIISNKYNLSGLILPKEWEINLKKSFIGENFAFYKLN